MKRIMRILITCWIALFAFTACQQYKYDDWKTQNRLWLEHNKTQPGVITTPTGLQYKVIYPGTKEDRKPNATSYVTVDYRGKLIDGVVFEDRVTSGYVNTFIQGWVEGLCKMHLNADFIFYIPSELAYGEQGAGKEGYEGFIPPHSTLIFEIHLSDIAN